MAKYKAKKKNPFLALPEEYKTKIESASDEEIRQTVAQVAFDEQENLKNKSDDQDLYEKKLALKDALGQYTDGTKMNRLKIKYAHTILEARGKV